MHPRFFHRNPVQLFHPYPEFEMDNAPALKFCPCCASYKPAPDYTPDRRNKDGLNYRCKACAAGHVAKMRSLRPEHYRETVRRYRATIWSAEHPRNFAE